MALTSTLFTGLSGLDVNQTRLNVVGNNIANANTVGFKSSRALFKPQFYVTDEAGAPPDANFGGSNPSQRGLGATVATIEKNFDPGPIESTGKSTDLAIDGDGFFIVQGQQQLFTRDGAFNLNSNNQLVTSGGELVQGYGADANGNILSGKLQDISIPLGTVSSARPTRNVTLEGNLNANGAVASGASILNSQALTDFGGGTAAVPTAGSLLVDLRDPANTATPLVNAGDVITVTPKRGGRDLPPLSYTVGAGDTITDFSDFLQQSMGIDTTVASTPPAPAPGVTVGALTGDAANTGHIIITGNLGTDNAISLTGSGITSSAGSAPFNFADGADLNGVTSDPSGESVYTSITGYDSLGTPITINVTAVLESKATTGNTWRFFATSPNDTDATTFAPGGNGQLLGTGTLTFDTQGQLVTSTGTTLSVDRQNTGAISPLSMTMDVSSITSLTSQNSDLVMTKQDGSAIGSLNSFSIGTNGIITGSFSNGLTRSLGQLAVATFKNNAGLVDNGGNMYNAGADSGVPIVSAPMQVGSGAIRAGSLEQSNVDISTEFINLIVASTGFSASSRVITTSDQLLTELLQSAR